MKKFILINSPIFWEQTTNDEDSLPPLGQGYIATQLDKRGIEVEIVDCVKRKMGVTDIIDYVNNSTPEYAGINIFTQNYDLVKYIVERLNPNIKLFIGGQAVKFLYKDILEWDINICCYIIAGEGELIIPDICLESCKELPKAIKGNRKYYNVDKNSIYFPQDISFLKVDRKFFDDELLINHYGEKEAAIVTSRGCVFNCAFCGGARSLNKDSYPRVRSRESIINELTELVNLYNDIQCIRILDD